MSTTTTTSKPRPRTVKVDNIVGNIEIAARIGATSHAVWNWTKRDDFPKPIGRVSGRPIYDWSEIDAWNKAWDRSKGGFHTHRGQLDAKRPAKKAEVKPAAKKAAPAKKVAAKAPAKKTAAKSTNVVSLTRARRLPTRPRAKSAAN